VSRKKATSTRPRLTAEAPEHLRLVGGHPAADGRLTVRVRPGRSAVMAVAVEMHAEHVEGSMCR
jgi:hypothetical protein